MVRKNNTILRPLLAKWLDIKEPLLDFKSISLILLILVAIGSFVYVNFIQLAYKSSANMACPFPASPEKVHGQVILTPTSTESIYDCSSQDVIIASDAEVIVGSYVNGDGSITGDYGAEIVFKNLTIETGGILHANGMGYKPGESDGGVGNATASTDNVGGSGGGYGGAGGEGASNGLILPGQTGQVYGNAYIPNLLGGAGGNSTTGIAGSGGGAIKLNVSENLLLNGTISANGTNGSINTDNTATGGGGAGGSIWINVGTLAGTGSIQTRGGNANSATYQGGGGGGGRAMVVCQSGITFTGTASVSGGAGAQEGQVGSLIGPGCIPNIPSVSRVYEGNGVNTRQVPFEGLTKSTTLTFVADLVDPNSSALVRTQIEIREVGQNFSGVPTHTQTSYVSNNKNCANGIADCGIVTASGLTAGKEYKYRVRTINSTSVASEWLDVGSNGNNADFTIVGTAVGFELISGDAQTGTVGQLLANPLEAKLIDANGFGVPNETVSWTILTGAGSLPQKSTQSDEFGNLSASWQLGTVSGINNNTLRLSKTGVAGTLTITASATPDIVATYILTVPSIVQKNTNFSITINAVDKFNNAVPVNDALTLSAVLIDGNTPGNGTLAPTSVNLVAGTVTLSIVNYTNSEVIKIKATNALDANVFGRSNSILIVDNIGNCPDIDIDENQTWQAQDAPNGVFDCRGLGTFNVRSGFTLTLRSYDNGDTNWSNDFGVTILADAFNIESGAIVSADALGYGPSRGPGNPNTTHMGASHGGYGSTSGGAGNKAPYGSVYEPLMLGSSGGVIDRYSYGGGSIKLVSSTSFTHNGTITVNGSMSPSGWSGGGSAGSVWIDTVDISGSGLITANGGRGDQNGGGSGGRVAVYYENNISSSFNFRNIQARGNNGGWGGAYAGAGTVYFEQKGVDVANQGWIIVDNNNFGGGNYAGLTEGNYTFNKISLKRLGNLAVLGQNSVFNLSTANAIDGDSTKPKLRTDGTFMYLGTEALVINGIDLEIKGDLVGVNNFSLGTALAGGMTLYAKTWAFDNTRQYTFENINVGSSGTLTLVSYDNGDTNWTNDYGVSLTVDNLTVNSSGKITADGLGYGPLRGPGNPNTTHTGASHGGYGSTSAGVGNRAPYGSVYEPVMLGSAGGVSDRYSYGGGSIKLNVSGLLENNGTISANGSMSPSGWSGGGSGGSIWVDANEVSGIGLYQTNGGIGDQNGGGSGGRIAVYYNTNVGNTVNFMNIQSRGNNGGWGGYYGGPGTVYVSQKGVDVANQGWLIVNNNNFTGGNFAGLVEGEYSFRKLSLKNKGNLTVLGQNSLFTLTTAEAIDGDTSMSQLRTQGVFSYSGIDTLQINGIDINIQGDIQGVNNFILGNSLAGGLTLNAFTWAHDISDTYLFNSAEIGTSGRLTLNPYNNGNTNWLDDYPLKISFNSLIVASGGRITADGLGYGGGSGPGTTSFCDWKRGGAGHGGYGATAECSPGGAPYGNVYEPITLGSGNNEGSSRGGGAFRIDVNSLNLNGKISVNGTGQGSGGSIWLNVNEIGGIGSIESTSINRSDGNQGGGSGGRIAVYYQNISNSSPFNFNTQINASGGEGANWVVSNYGGAGTIYIEKVGTDSQHAAKLISDNKGKQSNGSSALLEGDYSFSEIRAVAYGHLRILGQNSRLAIGNGGIIGDGSKPNVMVDGTIDFSGDGALDVEGITLTVAGDIINVSNFIIGQSQSAGVKLFANTWAHNQSNQYSFGDITIGAFGLLTLQPYNNGNSDWTDDYGVTLNLNSLNISNGGGVSSDGLGYGGNSGPGTTSFCDWKRGGAGHGGYGATAECSPGGAPYGNVYEPITLGSGNNDGGSRGGGAFKLNITSNLIVDGFISANGTGQGSGGSIWINTNSIGGNGTINVSSINRLDGNQGGGSGGRMAIYYQQIDSEKPINLINQLNASGGEGGNWVVTNYGGAGTVYIEQINVDPQMAAELIINNKGKSSNGFAALVQNDYEFKLIRLMQYGSLKVLGQMSNLTFGDNGIIGDNTKPRLAVEGTINFTGEEELNIEGLVLSVVGEINGVEDFLIGNNQAAGLELYAKTWAHDNENHYYFDNISVGNQGVVSLVPYQNYNSDWTDDYGVTLNVENLSISSGGKVTADGLGYGGNTGPGTTVFCDWKRGGAGHGGYGATAECSSGGATYGNIYEPITFGSGNNDGGSRGGGALKLNISDTLTLSGIISANGNGQGSGGSVWITTNKIAGQGSIQSTSINVLDGNQGGGAGGRIAVYYQENVSSNQFDLQNRIIAAGGPGGMWVPSNYGGPGTVYTEHVGVNRAAGGSLYINNNNRNGRSGDFIAGTYTFNDVKIADNITIWLRGDTVNNSGVVFDLTGDFYLGTNSQLLGIGSGFPSATGPGKGANATLQNGGGGGAHGGNGGNGESSDGVTQTLGGVKFGNQLFPLTLGSGGGLGASLALGGSGGGAIAIITRNGDVSIEGDINMNGTDGLVSSPGGGGGAGGSVLIRSNTCSINGDIAANGGDGGDNTFDGGGGGGGIISIIKEFGECNILGNVSVENGFSSGGQDGQPGLYLGVVTVPQISLDKQTTTSDELIPVGGFTNENQVKLTANILDPGADESNPVELVADFDVLESSAYFPNNQVLGLISISSNVITYTGGSQEEVTVLLPPNLVPGESYKWRARVRNITTGITGEWTQYGNNGDAADFIVSDIDRFAVIPSKNNTVVGESISLRVRALDNFDNLVQGYTGTVLFSVEPETNPNTVLPDNYTFSVSDLGEHNFVDELMFFVPGSYIVTATDSDNGSIVGSSSTIVVTEVPVTTVVITTTTVPTTTVPTTTTTVTPSITTDNVTPTPSDRSCSENPLQAKCQVNVVISNIVVNVDEAQLSAEICWNTNIATVGNVTYGEELLSNSTEITNSYVNTQCVTLEDLSKDTSYNFEIFARSIAGRTAKAPGQFVIGSADDNVPPLSCININHYSFSSDSIFRLEYDTAYQAKCNVTYTYLLDREEIFKDEEKEFMIYHLSSLNLNGLDKAGDISYNIFCNLDSNEVVPDGVTTCELNGSVPQASITRYLPETGSDTSEELLSNISSISQYLPLITAPVLIAATSAVAISNPQIFYYGIFWLRRKKKAKAWGLVYDEQNKRPVAFAVARVFDGLGSKLIKEEVCSIDGKYNFIVDKGRYQLVIEHSDYETVKKQITADTDEYTIAYEIPVTLRSKPAEGIKLNIWQHLKIFFIKNNDYLVACGLLITLIALIFNFTVVNIILLALYVIQELLILRAKRIKWGKVVDFSTKESIGGVFVRLYDEVQQRQLEVTLTDNKGRYKFNTKDGSYLATVFVEGAVLVDDNKIVTATGQEFSKIQIKSGVTQNIIEIKKTKKFVDYNCSSHLKCIN